MTGQSKKIIVLTAAGVLISLIIKSGKFRMQFKKFEPETAEKLSDIYTALKAQGLNDKQIKFALAQVLHETGNFTPKSNVARLNTNFSGIKWINKPYQKASKGSPVPPSERVPGNVAYNFYAKFDSVKDWAIDYIRILKLKNNPLGAETLGDFLAKVAANKYYDLKGLKAYQAGVTKYFDMLS